MAKYIERDLVYRLTATPRAKQWIQSLNHDEIYEQGWEDAMEMVENLPAADVAPVQRGHWGTDRGLIKCSACGYGMYPNYCRFMDGACVGTGYNEPNYCPNCGAKMEGKEHE